MKRSKLYVAGITAENVFDFEEQEAIAYANHPMHELLKGRYDARKMPDLREIVEGTIVGKGRKEYFVSIAGIGSDAFLPFNETTEELTIGQTVSLYVDGIAEKSDEGMYLSQKKAVAWIALRAAQEDNLTLEATIKGAVVRGGHIQGFKAVCNSIGGFIPRSHFGRDLSATTPIDEVIPVKVLKANSNGSRGGDLVLSHRLANNEIVDATLAGMQPGQVLKGTVSKIITTRDGCKEIGALITLSESNFVGFLHSSEISDFRGTKPSAILTRGQEIEVEITTVDRTQREVKLTYKGLLTRKALEGLKEGDVVQGTVLRFKEKVGYFVSIGDNFTALLPCSRVVDRQNMQVAGIFAKGEKIDVVILELNPKANKAVVSYKEVAYKSLQQGEKYTGVVTKQLPHVGVFVAYKGIEGLLHFSEFDNGEKQNDFAEGSSVDVFFKKMNEVKGRNLIAWSRKSVA